MGARVVLLGTAGGALTYPQHGGPARFGTSTALVVDDDVYLVDAGQGAARQLTLAGLGTHEAGGRPESTAFGHLRGIFLTHLHSDHTMDLVNLVLCGYYQGWPEGGVDVFGPGPREGRHDGVVGLVAGIGGAFAADLDDRVRAAGKAPLTDQVRARPVLPPPGVVTDPAVDPAPPCEPFLVMSDERVTVKATLVSHGSMYPALAYRFDTRYGSVTFSGDTSPSPNLIQLARGADVLVHEAIDPDWGSALSGSEADALAAAPVLAKHTLATHVGSVAQEAGAKVLILTHLTPGNAPPETWHQAGDAFDGRLVIGHDLLQVPLPGRPDGTDQQETP